MERNLIAQFDAKIREIVGKVLRGIASDTSNASSLKQHRAHVAKEASKMKKTALKRFRDHVRAKVGQAGSLVSDLAMACADFESSLREM